MGGIISIIADYIDLNIILALGGDLNQYQNLDKILDLYYLSFEGFIVLTWKELKIKQLAFALFIWRFLGIVLFEITQIRTYLFLFPNLFEVFFLFYLAYQKIAGRKFLTNPKHSITFWLLLFLLFVVKLYEEYLLHLIDQQPWPGSELIGLG